ncbi:MAG: DUF3592 domain-containing protein [Planctomycetota bacterium]|jgi:hypothetical protein|nr:DUF3592 domain-containing protein [Planctomycetota bacterium]MDP6504124.1 DUF3592 domain-containing protein [Planctomycetota bacterium]
MSDDNSPNLKLPLRAIVDLLVSWPATFVALVFGLGMGLVWLFVMKTAPIEDSDLDKSASTVSGRIVPPVRDMGWSVGGRVKEGGTQIYRYRFSYEVDNQQYEALSYSTGKKHEEGKVEIEYLPDAPRTARIIGTRRGMMDRRVVWLSAIPAFAFLWLLALFYRGAKSMLYLQRGHIVEGTLTDANVTRSTNADSPDKWFVKFEFEDHEGNTSSGQDTSSLLSEPKPGDRIDLIYPADQPNRVRYLGGIVSQLEFDETGGFQNQFSASALVRIAVTDISIGANLLYGIWLLLR